MARGRSTKPKTVNRLRTVRCKLILHRVDTRLVAEVFQLWLEAIEVRNQAKREQR